MKNLANDIDILQSATYINSKLGSSLTKKQTSQINRYFRLKEIEKKLKKYKKVKKNES